VTFSHGKEDFFLRNTYFITSQKNSVQGDKEKSRLGSGIDIQKKQKGFCITFEKRQKQSLMVVGRKRLSQHARFRIKYCLVQFHGRAVTVLLLVQQIQNNGFNSFLGFNKPLFWV